MPSESDRRAAVLRFQRFIQRVARFLSRKLGPRVEHDDLVSAGYVGLLESLKRCDPARTQSFEAYAEHRIRGAIIDAARQQDVLSREQRSCLHAARQARERLVRRNCRPPTDEEMACELGCSVPRYLELRARIREARPLLLHERRVDGAEHFGGMSCPAQQADYSETRVRLRAALGKLPQRLRSVVMLLYYEGLTMQKVGELMSVTESRVSQMRTQAMGLLRDQLHDLRD